MHQHSPQQTDTIQFWVLNSASFVGQLSISMVNLCIVYFLKERFALSASMIGIATSIYTCTYFLFCIIGERMLAHVKPRHSVELSMVGMGLSISALAFARTLPVAYAALAVYGCAMSMLWPQIEGWFSRGKEGAQLNRVSSAFNFSWSFGAGLSTFIAGLLVERATTLPLFVGVGLFASIFLLIFIASACVPGIRAVASEHTAASAGQVDQSTPLRFFCWAGVVVVYTGLSVVQTIFPLQAMDHMHISEATTGFLLLIRGLTTCGVFVLMGRTSKWQFSIKAILGSQLLVCLVLSLGALIPAGNGKLALVLYGAFFLSFGVLFAIAYTLSMFHGASGSVNRSKRMMIHEVLLTVGTIVGAIFGGVIYQHISFTTTLLAIAALTGGTLVVEVVVLLARPQRFALHSK